MTASVDQSARCLPRDRPAIKLVHPSAVRSVLPIPSTITRRALVLTGADDEEIRVWDVEDPDMPVLVSTVPGHCGPVTGLAVWDARVISSSLDGTLRYWTMQGGSEHGWADCRIAGSKATCMGGEGGGGDDRGGRARIGRNDGIDASTRFNHYISCPKSILHTPFM
jgi:WD40 repeat protein